MGKKAEVVTPKPKVDENGLTQTQRNEIAQGKAEHEIYVTTNNLPTKKEAYDSKIIQAIANMDN